MYSEMTAYFTDIHAESTVLNKFDEYVNSKLFDCFYSDELRYVRERRCWYYYHNGIWQPDIGNLMALKKAKILGRELLNYAFNIEDSKKRTTAISVARRWQTLHAVETVIRNAANESPMSVNEFDNNPYLLNFRNGTFDLKEMRFRGHVSGDYLTRMMNADYDESANCRRFNEFIFEIMNGDSEMIKYLNKALGYALDGVCREECLFILYGASTRNGKSTLMESVLDVMGTYGCSSEPETLAQKGRAASGAPSENIARLKGRRLVCIAEPDKNLVFNAARVKTMTGNDTVNARFLHENSFQFRPEATFFINTNHLPQVTDITLFTSDRLRVIPFERHFSPREQQKNLKQIFAEEKAKSAIANFLITGYHLWTLEGLTPPEQVKQALDDYLTLSDRVKQFITDCLTPCEDSTLPTAHLYTRYCGWCLQNGCKPYALNKFCESLKRYAEVKRVYINGKQTRAMCGFAYQEA